MTGETSGRSAAVVVFTFAYPYGRGEEFLDGELPHLVARFDRVVVVPTLQVRGQHPTRAVPDGVVVVAPDSREEGGAVRLTRLTLRHPLAAARGILRSLARPTARPFILEDLLFELFAHHLARTIRRRLGALIDGFGSVVLYGFWLAEPARVALAARDVLRRPEAVVVSRANGFDLFAERAPRGHLPQRREIVDRVDRVFAASAPAEQYLRERFPEFAAKYSVERIGSQPPVDPGNVRRRPVHIVSCSYISPVKRLPMLIDGLAELRRRGVDFSWSHLGSGEADYVAGVVAHARERLAPGSFEFVGHLESGALRQWYADHPATFFVQMSESEGGLAASIQEALAQGLPAIVTRVGGVAVLADTDLPLFDGLMDPEHTPEEFADRVERLLTVDDATYRSYSSAAMEYWEQNCSVDRLAGGFAARLRALVTP